MPDIVKSLIDAALEWLHETTILKILFPELEATVDLVQETGRQHKDVFDAIRESRQFSDDTQSTLESAYDDFLDQFETSEGQSIKPGTEAKADPVTDEELEQEQIVKQKRN